MTDLTYTDYCARCGRVEEVTPQPIEGGLLWRCGACDAVVDVESDLQSPCHLPMEA